MGCLVFGLYWLGAFILVGAFLFQINENSPESAWTWLAITSFLFAVVLMIPTVSGRRRKKRLRASENEHTDHEDPTNASDPSNLPPYEYEKYVAKTLLERGYKSAEVTQQSNDYGADVIAVNSEGWRIAIQCKRYQHSVGISAVQEALTAREYYDCDLAAVYTTGSYTQQALNVARKTHVKLYILDRDGLRMAA